MWAQLITVKVKPGRDGDLTKLADHLRSAEQEDSGLLRSTMMRDQDDPSTLHMMVVFENEEKARERENDPRRAEGLDAARATMAEIFDGPPTFTNLEVVDEWLP